MHVVTLAQYVPNPDASPPELVDALDIVPAVIAELAAVPAAR